MTDVAARRLAVGPAERRGPSVVASAALGLVAGSALGAAARAWMRLISEDPEFTWAGTLFIVGAFTLFGTAQGAAIATRRRHTSPRRLTAARAAGGTGMLPLFTAAGLVMLPTVLGAGLALWHPRWRPGVRLACVALAAAPVIFVSQDLVGTFGWSLRTLAGVVGLVAIYGTVVVAAQATFLPPVVHRPRAGWVKWAIVAGAVLLVLVPLGIGGVQ